MEEADRAHKEHVFARTQEFWKDLTRKQQTDGDDYLKAAWTYARGLSIEDRFSRPVKPDLEALTRDTSWQIMRAVGANDWRPGAARQAPRRVLRSDFSMPTNRTTEFSHDEASIEFDRATSTHFRRKLSVDKIRTDAR